MFKRVLISTSFFILMASMGLAFLSSPAQMPVTAQDDPTPTADDAPTAREVYQDFYLISV